ncbi:hypothetical protein [Filimonas lacunae]|nr:hypothetical protein [Filimonas lacunae]
MINYLYNCIQNDRMVDLLLLQQNGMITVDEQIELDAYLMQPDGTAASVLFMLWQDDKLRMSILQQQLIASQFNLYHT